MKILHIGKFFHPYHGGMENFLTDLTLEQSLQGNDVSVLVHHHQPLAASTHSRTGAVEVTRMLSLGQLIYAPVSPSFGLHVRSLLSSFNPDVIHLHLPNLSAFWLLLQQTSTPMVVQWQSDVVRSKLDLRLSFLYPLYRIFEQKLIGLAQAVIVSSENYFMGSSVLWPHQDKCHTIPLGINPTRVYKPIPEEIRDVKRRFGKPLVLSAGRFTYYKGFGYLIEAAVHIDEAVFVIVGDGPLRTRMLQKVKQSGLEKKVLLPGSLTNRELHTLMAACDVFALPSIERTESFGIVLLEAMIFGKPLITTDIEGSGVNWVNLAGETGMVVRAADADALADAIHYLLRNPETRLQMGERARDRLNNLFHIERVGQRIMDLYSTFQTPPLCGS